MAQQVARVSPDGTKFWAYTPPSYNANDPTGSPLLIALHGASGIGDDLNILSDSYQGNPDQGHMMPARLIYRNIWDIDLPFIVISPQMKRDLSIPNPNDQRWSPQVIDEVVEYVLQQYNIDEARIYVTGISLGGNGTWNYAAQYPEKVAAMVPISGVTQKEYACRVKDIPTWAIHGENDPWVRPDFTIDMADAVNSCVPTGKFKPHVSLVPAQQHEGWNTMLTRESSYDMYNWLLKFEKGNHANTAPYVTAAGDRKITVGTPSIYITGDYFDVDGTIQSVQWTQVSGSPVVLEGANTRQLKVSSLVAGSYSFRLSVTDDDGVVAEDVMNLSVVNPSGPQITQIFLALPNNSTIRPLVEDDIVQLSELGGELDFIAQANSDTRSVMWSIDSYERIMPSRNGPGNYNAELRNGVTSWIPEERSYLICATPYPSGGGMGTMGIQKCFRVTFTGTTYYAKNGSNIGNLSAWGIGPTGSGTEPASFTASPAKYIIPAGYQVTMSGETEMHPVSNVVVASGATATFVGRFTLAPNQNGNIPTFPNLTAEGNSTVRITHNSVAVRSLSVDNTFIVDNGNGTIPPADYGTLILRSGTKTIPNGGIINVRKRLVIEGNTTLLNSPQYNGQLNVSGEMEIQNAVDYVPIRPVDLTIGGPNASIKTSSNLLRFRRLRISSGSSVPVVSSTGTTVIQIASASGDGSLIVEKEGVLVLDGHNLSLQNDAAINPSNESGSISLEGSELTWNVSTSRNSNLYPTQGSHKAARIQVTATGGGQIVIRDSLKISNDIRVNSGTVQSNGFLVLTSSGKTHAASVGPVGGSGNITGIVNVERFVDPGRNYKYMSFPVSGMRVADLQEYIPVTGEFGGTTTGAGLSTQPSLYYYNEPSGGWVPYPAANSNNQQPLNLGTGYAVYMRNEDTPEKVIASGLLHIGSYPFTLTPDPDANNADDGWNLIGNPYASSIFWGTTGWTRSQVNQSIAIRDNDAGIFRYWDGDTGAADDFNGVIASGQSIWVRAIGQNPQLTITEAAKVPDNQTFFRTANDVSALRVKLTYDEHYDNAYIKFKPGGNPALDNERDAVKRKNDHINFAVLTSDGASVAIKNLSDTLCIHETALAFEPSSTGMHTIMVEGTAFTKTIAKLRLIDHYLDSTVTLAEGEEYTFSVTGEHKSAAKDRFSLWIETGNTPDPVITFTDGMLTTTGAKSVQWLLDGVEIPGATGLTLQPEAEGEYQVRMTKGGCTKTSEKFAFRITSTSPTTGEVAVYPNPARGHLNVAGVTNPGTSYSIISVTGTVVQQGTLSADAHPLIPTDNLAPGVYMLHLQDSKGLLRFRVVIQ